MGYSRLLEVLLPHLAAGIHIIWVRYWVLVRNASRHFYPLYCANFLWCKHPCFLPLPALLSLLPGWGLGAYIVAIYY